MNVAAITRLARQLTMITLNGVRNNFAMVQRIAFQGYLLDETGAILKMRV